MKEIYLLYGNDIEFASQVIQARIASANNEISKGTTADKIQKSVSRIARAVADGCQQASQVLNKQK